MKNALISVLFLSFAIGVFGDEVKIETVSVIEGESVTLHTGVTEIKSSDRIEWRLNGKTIARIRDGINSTNGAYRVGMQLDHQTGDLKITNIKTTDSGLYKVEITSTTTRSRSVKIFSVSDILNRVSVKEGVTVTLESGVTELYSDNLVRWRFEHGDVLAEINKTAGIFSTYDDGPDGRFRDRLKLDHQTGSLTITHTKRSDSGLYHLDITSDRRIIFGKFIISVSDDVTLIGPAFGVGAGVGAGVVLGLLLVAAAACGMYYRHRGFKLVTRKGSECSGEDSLEKLPI